MLKHIILFFILIHLAQADTLPDTAKVLERTKITPERDIWLWMENPEKTPRDTSEDIYSCPEQTRGHYYTGIAKVSLINTQTKTIIQTLDIKSDDDNTNKIDLPYLIKHGYYYSVPKTGKNQEGKPQILLLKDYNNDGKKHEFALFDAIACMGLETSLIGYSEKQDKLMQYQTELKTQQGTRTQYWTDYLFTQQANKQGIWQYEIDYRGRAGSLDKYDIHYDKQRELFYGTLNSIHDEIN